MNTEAIQRLPRRGFMRPGESKKPDSPRQGHAWQSLKPMKWNSSFTGHRWQVWPLTVGAWGAGLWMLAFPAGALAQGEVMLYGSFGYPASVGWPAPGTLLFGLLTAPPGTSDLSLFTPTSVLATNLAVPLAVGGTVAVPGWLAGEVRSYAIVGWSASLGTNFNPAWLAGCGWSAEGGVGVSSIGLGSPGGINPLTGATDPTLYPFLEPNPGLVLRGALSPELLPRILDPPRSQTVKEGSTVTFTVFAEPGPQGPQVLTYQWRFRGVDLPDATNATLVLTNVQASQSGAYSVRVSNPPRGIICSSLAYLTFLFAPPVEEFTYTTTYNNTITVTGCTGPGGTVNIPSTINGLPVTSISTSAFSYCFNLASVTIPDSVATIEESAFLHCYNLTNVTIGNGVASIGDWAFGYCTGLTNLTIGGNVTSIEDRAFSWCTGLAEVTLPNSVASIGAEAFGQSTSLTTITIPDGVTNIGNGAFDGCTSLASVSIGNRVASIPYGAFSQCSSLTRITIPNSVTNIDPQAFFQCTSLASVSIGNRVISIPYGAFFECSSLTNVTIPNSVTNIGDTAFWGCTKLTDVTIPDSVLSIGDWAFLLCESLTSVTIPTHLTKIGYYLFGSCSSLTSVTIPGSVTSIGDGAFDHCTSLPSITIPSGVVSIGERSFSYCPSLTSITVDNANPRYHSLDGVLFNNNQTMLIQYPGGKPGGYTIPNSVRVIGSYAFAGCTILGRVEIPASVTSILDDAFDDCTNLTNLTVGNSVTNIGEWAFQLCTGLTGIFFRGNAPAFGQNVFESDNLAIVYYLPATTGWGPTFAGRPTALWNPQAKITDGSFGVRNNQFGFNIAGTQDIPLLIEAATNLPAQSWIPLQTCTLTNGLIYFSDPEWTNYPARFYRIRWP